MITAQLGQLTTRVAVLEQGTAMMRGFGVGVGGPGAGMGGNSGGGSVGGAVNPLFFDSNGSPQVRGEMLKMWGV